MNYSATLKTGSSLCITGELTREALQSYKDNGIECAEVSFDFDYFFNRIDFPKNAAKYGQMAREIGVELYSIHLPFSGELDISSCIPERRNAKIAVAKTLIAAARQADIKVAVLHPSSEPIPDAERPQRFENSRAAIIELNAECKKHGLKLAVENLPRTCLCNTSAEMFELLDGTGADVVFDTNHSLQQTSVEFLHDIIARGLKVISLHISDYDFVDERHRLPGDGVVDWKQLFRELQAGGYTGPMMYEISRIPKDRDLITVADVADNMRWLQTQ